MLLLLSPAKTLDFEGPEWSCISGYRRSAIQSSIAGGRTPLFIRRSRELAAIVGSLSVDELRTVFGVSAEIAATVHRWYREWTGAVSAPVAVATGPGNDRARPAIQVFRGEAFRGFDGATMSAADLDFAQAHLRVFSGLYGVLRPLDVIEPYRMDFDTRLPGLDVSSVYQYWRETVAAHLTEELDDSTEKAILNLSSAEYGRVTKVPALRKRVVNVSFLEESDGKRRTVGVYAKRARGLLARYVIDNRIDDPGGVTAFDLDGYRFDAEGSDADAIAFVAVR